MDGKNAVDNWLLLSFLLVVWGVNFVFVKVGLEYATPLAFTFYRMFIATLVTLPLALRSLSKIRKFDKKALLATLAFAVCVSVVFQAFWFLGEALIPAGLTAVVIYTYPLFTVLFTKMFLSDRLTPFRVAGVVAGFVGIVLVLTSGRLNVSVDPHGVVFLVISAIGFAGSFIVYRRWLLGQDPIALNFVQLVFASSILFVWVLLSNAHSLIDLQFTNVNFLGALLFVTIPGTALAYLVWMKLVSSRGPVWVSTWLFLVPVVALASSVLFLGESVDLIQSLGFLIIVTGIAAVSRG